MILISKHYYDIMLNFTTGLSVNEGISRYPESHYDTYITDKFDHMIIFEVKFLDKPNTSK